MVQGKHGEWEIQESYMPWREAESKIVEENISPELPSLPTGGNFEKRAKLRGLRSQEELLSAQHICESLHLLKCLSRDFGI